MLSSTSQKKQEFLSLSNLLLQVYFVDYLKRCQCYGVTKDDPPPLNPPSPPGVGGASGEQPRKTYDQMAAERAAKIQRLREKKELERRTEELTAVLDRGRGCGGGEEEEEEEEEAGGREQWVAMLQLNVYRSREFVKSIEDEIPILRHMETLRKGEGPPVAKRLEASGCGPPRQPAKPIVITREMLRVSPRSKFSSLSLSLSFHHKGEVFGAGYPSVPTMTVEEFYQQRYGGGGGGAKRDDDRSGVKEEEEEKEDEEEDDSEEAVKKAREWDEFKDGTSHTHRMKYILYITLSLPCRQ